MFRIYCLLIGYIFGHIQTSYILGKAIKKIDIREHGTGNPGTSNSLRVMGVKFALPILVVDVVKSILAFSVCAALFGGMGAFIDFSDRASIQSVMANPWLPGVYGSIGAILGHMFPTYMRFRGGKSIACWLGLLIALNILMAAVFLSIAALSVLLTRYISSAIIVPLALLPVILFLFDLVNSVNWGMEVLGAGYFITILLLCRHKNNIRKLLNGVERPLGQKAVSSVSSK